MQKGIVMLRSMTGFGRGESAVGGVSVVCEIKTVNSKFLDVSVKLPLRFAFFEPAIKSLLTENGITRGKADVRFEVDFGEDSSVTVEADAALAKQYLDALNALSAAVGDGTVFTVRDVVGKPDVLKLSDAEIPADAFVAPATGALAMACRALTEMRGAEGEKLYRDFDRRLIRCSAIVDDIDRLSEQLKSGYYSRLEERLRKALEDYKITPDEQRILTECAIFADKVSVDEETVRLRSHVTAFRELCDSNEAVGRKLDFLVQEMNREANTIGSKCSDKDVAHMVVELKNEIEKIREQVQNIE